MNSKLLHNILLRITMAIAVMVVGMLFSCSNDIPMPVLPENTDSDYDVSIKISAGTQSKTRSILPEEYGTQLENTIELNDLKIMIFDSEDKLFDILFEDGTPNNEENVTLTPLGFGEYILKAKLNSDKYTPDSEFSIVVLANWSDIKEDKNTPTLKIGETLIKDLEAQTYLLNTEDAVESWTPSVDSLIPMFGILYTSLKGYSKDIFSEVNPMDLGAVNLLRAVVKLEIVDNSGNDEKIVKINSITLSKRNTRGYLLPLLGSKKNTQQVTVSHIPQTGINNYAGYKEQNILFKKSGNKYVAYVPEIELGNSVGSRDNIININLEYTYNEEGSHYETRSIVLAPYNSEGKPFVPTADMPEWKALLRNHIYRFTINSLPNLDLTVDVQPYSSVELSVNLGLERTEDGYIIVRDKDGNVIKYIRTDGEELTLSLDTRWPYLGYFMGVFDSMKRVLVGYLLDKETNLLNGRIIIFNYHTDNYEYDKPYENLESWEIYSSSTAEDGKTQPVYLEETFCFIDFFSDTSDNSIIKYKFTHTILDNKGRVIEQYRYGTLEAFQKHKNNEEGVNRTQLVGYKGDKNGDKTINYYNEDGSIYCQIIVTGENEEYRYENFIN